MKTGHDVTIVGRPNVGKSALFNRIAGRRIAIVHDQPGITRDRISAQVPGGGKPFRLWDTGGVVGAGETELMNDVRASAQSAIEESDLLLFVVDAREGLTPVDRELARLLRRTTKPVLLVVNKVDDAKHEPHAVEFAELGFDNPIHVSAAHGRNAGALLERIEQLLPPEPEEKVTPAPATKIAIIGRPNAGKSSLINTLLRDRRTIVSETPGTTRDSVDVEYVRHGKPYLLIDTAGIRARSKHSSSVEVFSVMRAEKTIQRADLCLLVVDVAEGVTAQDRRIAGLMQKANKPGTIILNKWDVIRPRRNPAQFLKHLVESARAELFFMSYAPVLVVSAKTGEHSELIFRTLEKISRAARARIGTGKLNRLLRAAFAANPPPMIGGRRLKLFYATEASHNNDGSILPPKFVLFVNSPGLVTDPFRRFLESKIREAEPYPGLPLILTFRPRSETRER